MSSLFVLGVTGYIGGSALVGFKAAFPSITSITALVRSEADNAAVEALGVQVLQGSHSDLDKITEASSQADIVLNAADADDLPLTKAVLAGLKKRFEASGSKHRPILIHTSGTGVVSDRAEGEFLETTKVWNDNNEDEIRSIDPRQPHRNIDLEIFAADEQGYVSAYIIAPSTIYGTGTGPKHVISQQIPIMVRVAVARKQTAYIGKGTNVWDNVHIKDLADLYVLVLQLALSGTNANTSYGKFYFGSARTHAWGEVAKKIAPLLYTKGLVLNSTAASVPLSAEPRLIYNAINSRTKADRAFALGWKPKQPTLEDTLPEDVDSTLALLSL